MATNNKEPIVLNDAAPFYAVHPGSILQEELKARNIKQKDFAKRIGMEPTHLSALIHGVRNVTVALAAKLEEGLGIPASQWINLQSSYNLDKQRMEARRLSSLVDGYKQEPAPAATLAQPESPRYGLTKSFHLQLPPADVMWFKLMADRMGWVLEEKD